MGKETLDSKPITNDLEIWDIDDSNLDSLIEEPKSLTEEPVLDFDTPKGKAKQDMFDDFEEEETPKKKETPKAEEIEEEDEELPEFDPGEEPEEEEEETEEEPLGDKKAAKEEEAETQEEENEFSVFAKMLNENELLDLPEDFEASEEGLMDAFAGTIENRVKEEIELFQKSLPEEGKDLLRHLMQGGSVASFTSVYAAPDVTRVNLEGHKNISNQRAVLQEFLRLRGDSPEDIQETLQDYEDLGKLEQQSKKAQQKLSAYYNAQKKQLAQKQEQAQAQRLQKRQEVLDDIQKTITNSTEIKGFPMSIKVKKDLISYMTDNRVKIDTENGPQYVTQFQADEMEAGKNVDDFILRAYLRMTDFSLDGVKKKTTTDLSSKLKDQLQRSKTKTATQAKFGSNKKTGKASSDAWMI